MVSSVMNKLQQNVQEFHSLICIKVLQVALRSDALLIFFTIPMVLESALDDQHLLFVTVILVIQKIRQEIEEVSAQQSQHDRISRVRISSLQFEIFLLAFQDLYPSKLFLVQEPNIKYVMYLKHTHESILF